MKPTFRLSINKATREILCSEANIERAEKRMKKFIESLEFETSKKIVFKIKKDASKKDKTKEEFEIKPIHSVDKTQIDEKDKNLIRKRLFLILKEEKLYGKYYESDEYKNDKERLIGAQKLINNGEPFENMFII